MLYVCENNLWCAYTQASGTLALEDVAARAAGYGIPGVVVDGNKHPFFSKAVVVF